MEASHDFLISSIFKHKSSLNLFIFVDPLLYQTIAVSLLLFLCQLSVSDLLRSSVDTFFCPSLFPHFRDMPSPPRLCLVILSSKSWTPVFSLTHHLCLFCRYLSTISYRVGPSWFCSVFLFCLIFMSRCRTLKWVIPFVKYLGFLIANFSLKV